MALLRWTTVVAIAAAILPITPAAAQQGGGMKMAGMHDTASMGMMRLVHEMMMNHQKIRRSVTNLPDGVRTVTESDDPALQRVLREHVATTGDLVRTSHDPNMPMETPALRGVLRNGANVNRRVESTVTGVIVTETSADSATVSLLQRHAAEVSDLVKRGMVAMHESMTQGGGMAGMAPMSGAHTMPGTGSSTTGGGMQHANTDSAFAAVQARGKVVMGVDQYTSTHHFEALSDGGRIELQRDTNDAAGVATIREHLRSIARAFGNGDFSSPAAVHMQTVPGAAVMAARRDRITYAVSDLPRGAVLRITTSDPEAVQAVAQFMAFQRMDHRAH